MRSYKIFIKESALLGIDDIAENILDISKSIITAEKYIEGLYSEIKKLSIYGISLPSYCKCTVGTMP